ncbi:MAG: MMPL family transporter [Opitutaceae bacterium]
MEPRRQKIFARLVLIVFAVGCVGWLARLNFAEKISTNVLDLIPAGEQAPELTLIRGFANDVQARVMLFAVDDPAAPGVAPTAAAKQLAAELTKSPLFAEAVVIGDDSAQTALGRQVYEHRFELLLPSWLGQHERTFAATGQPAAQFSSWLAESAAAELESFLTRPEATALQDLTLVDPLLLVPGLALKSQGLSGPGKGSGGNALVWSRIAVSPLAEEGQKPVFDAVEAAFARVRAEHPGVRLRWSGVNRFAAASRARIESELRLLNIASLLAVLAVSCIFVRRIYKILHLVPVIALSLLGAWTISTMVFDRLHILVFVIGSLLAGVAIDYGFYIYMQPSLREDEPYASKLRRLLKPLLASCLTTVIGFSLLMFSELPLIRQIGLFVGAGLLCALGAAMLYFAQLERPRLEGRDFGALGAGRSKPWLRGALRGLFVLALAIALGGPWLLHWRDDIRQLDIPSPELKANEESLRALFGESTTSTVYLTQGSSVADARQHLEDFIAYEAKLAPKASAASLGLLLPTEADWRELGPRLKALGNFEADFKAALDRHGFLSASFDGFFASWANLRLHPPTMDYAAVAQTVQGMLTGPMAMLGNLHGPNFWFLTMIEQPEGASPPAELHTVGVGQLQSLNNLFTRYRWSALRLSLIGLGLVIASVFAIYPFRRGVRIALIPAGSCFFVFGVLGLMGQTLNLFNLLGAFLGVCLSHNYAIFSSDNASAHTAPPVSIRLSALCTAASFGVLGFSRIPVIHALGMTVALIVLTALAAVELEPLARAVEPRRNAK